MRFPSDLCVDNAGKLKKGVGSCLVDGDGSVLLLLLLLLRLAFLRLALGIFRLHGLLGIKLLQIAEVEFEGYRLPVEIGFGIVCQSGTSGDVGACLRG